MPTTTCSKHTVFFYADDRDFPVALHRFFTSAVVSGSPMVLVMTPRHRALFDDYMRWQSLDPKAMASARLLVHLDAQQTLDQFCLGGRIDRAAFRRVVGGALAQTQAFHAGSWLWAYGEMVDLLAKRGMREQAIELEHLWNDLAGEMDFSLLCGYELDPMGHGVDARFVIDACAAHGQVRMLPTESERSLKVRTALRQEIGFAEAEALWETASSARPDMPEAYSVLLWLREHRPQVAQCVFEAAQAAA